MYSFYSVATEFSKSRGPKFTLRANLAMLPNTGNSASQKCIFRVVNRVLKYTGISGLPQSKILLYSPTKA